MAAAGGIQYVKGVTPDFDTYFSKYPEVARDALKDGPICKFDYATHSISTVVRNKTISALVKVNGDGAVVGVLTFVTIDEPKGVSILLLCSIEKAAGVKLLDALKEFIRTNDKGYAYMYLFPYSDENVEYYTKRGFRGNEISMKWEPSYGGGGASRKQRRRGKSRRRKPQKQVGWFF